MWSGHLTNLNYILAGLYPFKSDSLPVSRRAGLNIPNIAFNDKPVTNWYSILDEADKEHKLSELIKSALNDYPSDIRLLAALHQDLSGIDVSELKNWHPENLTEDTFEKIIGRESTLLDIAFLEKGLQQSASVVRILREDGATASGFLVTNNILITNHHVIASVQEANGCEIQFNFQKNIAGLDLAVDSFKTDPDNGFYSDEENDWTAVRLQGDANNNWGALALKENSIRKNDRVMIIQHPNGLPKQIALHHNYVRYADDQIVQYLTDTLPGSSGSPVFDDQWNLIAVHHAGGYLREPGTKRMAFRNEGIHINVVIKGLHDAGLLS